ncbi:TIGR02466 family protein [Asticcacaulis sp. BYS171W]|uniref:TIGR02466 family protein n=1 Tax=Asticcacaulis aquaticus TaxID=2984212 RepID=A0ABT5HX75_9CAUL|nr:TIGR02466 family protein [Asticcacaulis aquaticus]MDC7684672.1 TIGR02466 family protein [Asticcacaulis aquaticus]
MTQTPAGSVLQVFVTETYRIDLADTSADPLLTRLTAACHRVAAEDKAGQAWSKAKTYQGYTSYGSILDLTVIDPAFGELKALIETQSLIYARLLELDLQGKVPKLYNMWINVLDPGGGHTGHNHPLNAFSGTIYLETPPGSGDLDLEDPRQPLLMHAPPRQAKAEPFRRTFISVTPQRGTLVLWESWLRHQVGINTGNGKRLSISFNLDM